MAKETVGVEVDVQFQSVGNLKKEIRAATADVIAMQEKFGAASKEAIAAAKRVNELKDKIKDAKEVTDLFDPGNKFKALGNAVAGVASGFTAVQGAMGLFGSESKELEKQLLKVQSAMALSQGLSTLLDSGKDFSRLAAIIKTQVVAAFTTLRGAMMAVGIGLLTASIAFLIENFDKVKKVVYDFFPALKGLFDNMDRIKQIAMGVGNAIMQFLSSPISALIKVFKGDFSGAFEAVKNGMSFVKNFREGEQKEIKSQADEREKIRQEEIKKEKEKHDKLLEQQKAAAEQRRKAREEEQRKIREERERQRQDQLAADKVLNDARRIKLTEQQREEEDVIKKFEESKKTLLTAGIKDFTAIEEQKEIELAAIRKKYKDEEFKKQEANFQKGIEALLKLSAKTMDDLDKREQAQLDYNAAVINAEEQLNQAKFSAAEAGFNLLSTIASKNKALSNVMFAVEKGFAIGKIIVDTQREIAGYYANPTWKLLPDGGLSLATASATAAKIRAGISIATIAATSIGRFMNGGGANVPGGAINTKAPMTPTLSPTVQTNVQNAQAINQMSSQSTRAYVLNSDIQNEQQRNAYLQRNASI